MERKVAVAETGTHKLTRLVMREWPDLVSVSYFPQYSWRESNSHPCGLRSKRSVYAIPPQEHGWCSQKDLNPHLQFRKLKLFPLSYENMVGRERIERSFPNGTCFTDRLEDHFHPTHVCACRSTMNHAYRILTHLV